MEELSLQDEANINEIREYLGEKLEDNVDFKDAQEDFIAQEVNPLLMESEELNPRDLEVTYDSGNINPVHSAIIDNDFPRLSHLVEIGGYEVNPSHVSFAIASGASEQITNYLQEQVSRPGPEHSAQHRPLSLHVPARSEVDLSHSSQRHEPLEGIMSVPTPNYATLSSSNE
jgi:hypothetical protein